MIPGIVAGQMRIAGGYSGPVFVAASPTRFMTATSISETIPAQVQAGDFLVAAFMHRSTAQPPSGWALLGTHTASDSSFTQVLSIYTRRAVTSDANQPSTWGQSASNRMSLNIAAYRGSSLVNVAGSPATSTGTVSGVTAMPETAAAAGELVISAAHMVYAATAAPGTSSLAVSTGWTQFTPVESTDTNNQIRMGVARRATEISVILGGGWTQNITTSYPSAAGVITIKLALAV